MQIQQLLSQAKEKLTVLTETPSLEAEILLAAVLTKPRSYLLARPEMDLTLTQQNAFADLMARRLNQEPIAYILGQREFWSLPLTVNAHTLIPRPETECLVETALTLFEEATQPITVADLGTGSGAIALALAKEKPAWRIIATDKSDAALSVAQQNAQTLGFKQLRFYQGSWLAAVAKLGIQFDLIVSNPPYLAEREWEEALKYEPYSALVAGEKGLDAICEISSNAKNYLKSGGYIIIEHGASQGDAVRSIFIRDGYNNLFTIRDLQGHERLTVGRK